MPIKLGHRGIFVCLVWINDPVWLIPNLQKGFSTLPDNDAGARTQSQGSVNISSRILNMSRDTRVRVGSYLLFLRFYFFVSCVQV